MRDEEFLKNFDIDIKQAKIYSVHADTKQICFDRGDPMEYDKLLLATGGNARTPSWIKGIDAKNVYNIRNHND